MKIKVALRVKSVRALGLEHVNVLDAYAGSGKVWALVQERVPEISLSFTRIDKKRHPNVDAIIGDNLRIMPSLDLASFDLIDLDSYGVPNRQLRLCATYAPEVPVVVTCIANRLSPVPADVLIECGVPKDWTPRSEGAEAVFTQWRMFWWDQFCARLGYPSTEREIYQDRMIKVYQILHPIM
jgi:hypothetical protein